MCSIEHNQRFPYGIKILETGSCVFVRIDDAIAYVVNNTVNIHKYGDNLPTISIDLQFADIKMVEPENPGYVKRMEVKPKKQ